MKKFLLLLGMLLCAFNLSAQNYDSYLQKAYTALEEGKIEVAQSSYNIYKKMTGITDSDFEILLKDKIDNDWTKSCYIIDLGDGYSLAVQKKSSIGKLNYEDANAFCESNRFGGYNDWRLPTKNELLLYFSTIVNSANTEEDYYWASGCAKIVQKLNGKSYRQTIYTAVNQFGRCKSLVYQEKLINGIYYYDFSSEMPMINKFIIVRKFKR